MNKIKYIFVLLITFLSCKDEPKQFSAEALNDTFIAQNGDEVTFQSILDKHQGKTIVIDVWASWCSDCIKGMPKVKALQANNPEIGYVFLSLDREQGAWQRGIAKYQVNGDHYFMPNAKDCDFADFLNISWIPRYLVINKAGEIVVFNVIEADDDKLIKAIKN
ncbi:TlpA family protein disulfide reductase [Algibacter sp. L3A6]|uniref:TlpA family protein disulfide reductase n=1 Tax=Algibacter sp. L3A6 TaxID=2686366 RepID=UPI00131C4E23|nr:TlpA disulfide reductase family protein [Algibacter sp. L3A6]